MIFLTSVTTVKSYFVSTFGKSNLTYLFDNRCDVLRAALSNSRDVFVPRGYMIFWYQEVA